MADNSIAALLAGAGQTNANFDFGKLNTAYWQGLDEAYKRRTQDAFMNDPSLLDDKGNLDPAKAFEKALRVGGLPGADKVGPLSEAFYKQQGYNNAAADDRANNGPFPPSPNRDPASRTEPTPGRRSSFDSEQDPSQPQAVSTLPRGPGGFPPPPGTGPQAGAQPATLAPLAAPASAAPSAPASLAPRPVQTLSFRPPPAPTQGPAATAALSPAETVAQRFDMPSGVSGVPGGVPPTAASALAQGPQTAVPLPRPRPDMVQPQTMMLSPEARSAMAQAQPQAQPQTSLDPESLGGIIPPAILARGGGTAQGALAWLEGQLARNLPADRKAALAPIAAAIRKQLEFTPEQKNARTPTPIAELKRQETIASKRAESDVKEQDAYTSAERNARGRLATLNTIMNVATNDKNVGFGFGADTELRIKKGLQRIGFDVGDLSGAELIQKSNSVLASEMAKSLTSRPSQFEFRTFLGNNPGLMTTRQGTIRLASIYSQLAQRDIDLGRLARQQKNWDDWDTTVDRYDATHQIIDPILKKPIYTNSVVAPGPVTGSSSGADSGANASRPPGLPANGRMLPNGSGWVVPNTDPATMKTHPYRRWP